MYRSLPPQDQFAFPENTDAHVVDQRRELPAQPFLFVRAKVARSEISKAIGDGLGQAFPYAMQAGAPIAGRPTARYVTSGPGLFDLQIGIPIAVAAPGKGDVQAGELPGGRDRSGRSRRCLRQISAIRTRRWRDGWTPTAIGPAARRWESYMTNPGEFPDVNDWRTEVYWPLADMPTSKTRLPLADL